MQKLHESKAFIYLIVSPSNKRYIGSTNNVERRLSQYRRLRCKNQIKLLNSFKKYGFHNHSFKVLFTCDKEDVFYFERCFGEMYRCIGELGLNLMLPKSSEKPPIISNETREKMRKSHKGNSNWIGRRHSSESRSKISANRKGKHCGDAHWTTYKKFTPESKTKMHKSHVDYIMKNGKHSGHFKEIYNTNREELLDAYVNKNMSRGELANLYGVSNRTIKYLLKKSGIIKRAKKPTCFDAPKEYGNIGIAV